MILGFIKEILSKRFYNSKKSTLKIFKQLLLQTPTLNNKYIHLKKYLHINKLIINLQLKKLLNLSNISTKIINQSNKKRISNYFQNNNFFNLETTFSTKALKITGTPISRNKYNLSNTNE